MKTALKKLFPYGPNRGMVRFSVWLAWPLIIAGKRLSGVPVLRTAISPFFRRPHNEVTSIPINVKLAPPSSVPLPVRVLTRLVSEIDDKFILDRCICRDHNRCDDPPADIGCIALGPAIDRMHPSHGRRATTEEAVGHIRKASEAGLIANIAHVWIDPVAFGTRFHDLLFICFCDDDNCLYRTHMTRRGPNLDRAYEKLPGISMEHDRLRCAGCGTCAEHCFVAAIAIEDGKARIGESCKGCGRCAEHCPEGAIRLSLAGEEALLSQIKSRVAAISDLPLAQK